MKQIKDEKKLENKATILSSHAPAGSTVGKLQRFFGDLEVIDAAHELRIQPNTQDISGAVKGDPQNCAFARCLGRTLGSAHALFFNRVAYVDMLGPDGKRRVERFCMSPEAREFVAEFDRDSNVSPAGFILSPPSPSLRLDSKCRAKKLKNERTRKQQALLKGRYGSSAPRPKVTPRSLRLQSFQRGGAGLVQFSHSRDEEKS